MNIIISSQFFLLSLLSICFTLLAFGASNLPQDEVQALKDIGKTLGKKDWDFNIDPCNWSMTETMIYGEENKVSCNCSMLNDNFCHVVKIVLKSQNLQGTLPPELIRLPYLQEIDLTRNYLSGTIPREWGSSKLQQISLLGNRLTGPIPTELANITNLKRLILEFNQFYGNLPPELGNLSHIEQLHLSSNNFTGELPGTLARLTTLKEFRISDNQFSGNIPDFIQRWTSLEELVIQGSGLSGPIPSGISFLQKLIDLRISDLNGTDSTFPRVDNMKGLKTLILRSCNINDTLPHYLANLTLLQVLDLSYNKLSEDFPRNIKDLTGATYIYLTGNFLSGPVPELTKSTDRNLDLSYNNFTVENQEPETCYAQNVNLFASFRRNNSGPVSCNSSTRICTKTVKSLHINCGGKQTTIGGITYEEDIDPAGPAVYKESRGNWAISNTGHFLDNNTSPFLPYTSENQTRLYMTDTELYKNARISPVSLTYYGFCLENGDYTVKLRFAEIMFTDDNTYSSLGRRLFDVYIQGKRVLKDFNIANEAQGVGKELKKQFPAHVSSNDLEIRFYWAGKGTTYIPYKSINGPLISAISVKYISVNCGELSSNMSAGAIVAIVAAAVVAVILIVVGMLWWRGYLGKKHLLVRELKDLDLQTGLFTLHQIKAATNNFDISNKIGEGGFGPVYKGILSNGTVIAVKQLSPKSEQGKREFINEIGMISALQHPCLVKLYGCCVEGDQLLLVYEYMENNSLAKALFGPEECRLKLNWPTRKKICVGIARGLAFLHEESKLKVVHRDFKAANVLLDEDLNPKISDFGLAKLNEEDNTHISTRIAGTYGYMAPEYAMHGYLTDKADVYSFGIVVLEIVSGTRNTLHRSKEEAVYLLDWARLLEEKGNLMELVDKRLVSDFNEEEVMMIVKVALLCTNATSNLRPTMSSVLSILEGITVVPEFVSHQSEVMDEMRLEALRNFYSKMEENKIREAQSLSLSINVPWTASSSSAANLNDVHRNSSYWEGKKLMKFV
ncbi:probable LRR receptor-like serine/threonine-protein kinase At1g53420 [Gastrolobium bilobum]|uniref:probable LRR receptor-like serine/threonine-protein kinase At1g53420 n=1 Tax=Gastrolobium bilobum TaxID=150636 RepID=UPI002AB1E82C|nr:probable LRR receptor-like serine/threonine-protein kinase At1g53420 [Gastrolobium bilobum]